MMQPAFLSVGFAVELRPMHFVVRLERAVEAAWTKRIYHRCRLTLLIDILLSTQILASLALVYEHNSSSGRHGVSLAHE